MSLNCIVQSMVENDADTKISARLSPIALTILPMISVSTLSTVLYLSSTRRGNHGILSISTKGYQLALLLCLQLAHVIIITSKQSATDEISDEIMILSYVPVLFSIMDAFASSWRPYKQSICRMRNMKSSIAHILTLKTMLQSSIPSSLLLLYTTVSMKILQLGIHEEDKIFWQWASFVAGWIFCTVGSLARKRRLTGGMSTLHSNSFVGQANQHHFAVPDERGWEHWSTQKFLQWVIFTHASKPSINSNSQAVDDADELQVLLDVLEEERMTGESIPFLQLDDLRAMGISFGEAIGLLTQIQCLLHKYPSRNQSFQHHHISRAGVPTYPQENRNSGDGIDLDAWLGNKDQQNGSRRGDAADKLGPDGNENAMQQAKDFMSDRFGIELPIVMNNDNPGQKKLPPADSADAYKVEAKKPPPSFAKSSVIKKNEVRKTYFDGIDEAFLNAMPPNVREIAQRRPDLVKSLMSNVPADIPLKGQRLMAVKDDNDTAHSSLYTDEPLEVIDEEIGYCQEQPKNQEMMGLLRRRRNAS